MFFAAYSGSSSHWWPMFDEDVCWSTLLKKKKRTPFPPFFHFKNQSHTQNAQAPTSNAQWGVNILPIDLRRSWLQLEDATNLERTNSGREPAEPRQRIQLESQGARLSRRSWAEIRSGKGRKKNTKFATTKSERERRVVGSRCDDNSRAKRYSECDGQIVEFKRHFWEVWSIWRCCLISRNF